MVGPQHRLLLMLARAQLIAACHVTHIVQKAGKPWVKCSAARPHGQFSFSVPIGKLIAM